MASVFSNKLTLIRELGVHPCLNEKKKPCITDMPTHHHDLAIIYD